MHGGEWKEGIRRCGGGDEGHDIFESPEELTALLEDLSAHGGPVELILAGDFFDFLEIGEVPSGENRASMTISRPEYRKLFSALRIFARGEDRRVIYLPGNHDAEVWWNPAVQKTLREEGLVDEFALSYAARFGSVPERIIYCEHGNQFDPANTIKDYEDPLDTPLGDHIVTDLTRGMVSAGRITRSLDLRDVNKVYPLATIPEWVVGRFFYDLLGRVFTYLLVPLIVGYAAYWIVEYLLTVALLRSCHLARTLSRTRVRRCRPRDGSRQGLVGSASEGSEPRRAWRPRALLPIVVGTLILVEVELLPRGERRREPRGLWLWWHGSEGMAPDLDLL